MTDYMPRTYTQKVAPSVEANRFDGTLDMARWLAGQDTEHLTLMMTMLATNPPKPGTVSLQVHTTNGVKVCRTGDWIINDEEGDWHVMSDHLFRARYATDDPTDPDDPYNQEEA